VLTPGDLGRSDVTLGALATSVAHVLVVPRREIEQRAGVTIDVQQSAGTQRVVLTAVFLRLAMATAPEQRQDTAGSSLARHTALARAHCAAGRVGGQGADTAFLHANARVGDRGHWRGLLSIFNVAAGDVVGLAGLGHPGPDLNRTMPGIVLIR
jgi:hypothetical protein